MCRTAGAGAACVNAEDMTLLAPLHPTLPPQKVHKKTGKTCGHPRTMGQLHLHELLEPRKDHSLSMFIPFGSVDFLCPQLFQKPRNTPVFAIFYA